MTAPERSGSSDFDLANALHVAGIAMGPVERRRRLIPEAAANRVVEYFSSRVGGRLLAMPSNSWDSSTHLALAEAGMPVLPRETNPPEGFTLLHVPVGTNSLQSRLHLFRRNAHQYGPLFAEIAASQRRQYDAGLGVMVPGDVSIIERLAVIDDRSTQSGLKPYLLPPYDTDLASTPEAFALGLIQELRDSQEFAVDQLEYIGALIQEAAGGSVA